MKDDITWITKNGAHIPITNKYMNDKIREKDNWKKYIPKIEYGSEEVVEKYKEQIKKGIHRPILVNNEGDIIDGNHTMKAYQDLNIRPPQLYVGDRYDFFEEVQKTNFNEEEAINNMYKNKKAKKI